MDSVFVRGLSVRGKHGVHAREREEEQNFLFDVEASFDASTAAASDVLDDTVDYVRFVDIIERVVSANSFFLIEKLAETIALEIIADARIMAVSVTIQKPSALEKGIPGVTIRKTRT